MSDPPYLSPVEVGFLITGYANLRHKGILKFVSFAIREKYRVNTSCKCVQNGFES